MKQEEHWVERMSGSGRIISAKGSSIVQQSAAITKKDNENLLKKCAATERENF